MKSMKLGEYYQRTHPKYIYLKVTPAKSIRNYNSDKIAKAVASMYKNIISRIRRENNKFFFDAPVKAGYYIYIEKHKVEFYFIVPESHLNLIKDKISDTWKGITITKVDEIPQLSPSSIRYKLSYKKEDAMSLSVDHRNNVLLSSVLNVIEVIEDCDKVGIFYNFVPMSQYSWRATYQRTIKKLDDNYPIDREKFSATYVIKLAITLAIEIVNVVGETLTSFMGAEKQKPLFDFSIFPKERKLLPETQKKKDSLILKSQLLVMSESNDNRRAYNNAQSVCEAFKSITGDNEIIYRRHFNKVNMDQYVLPGIDLLTTTPQECQNFIELPGRELLEEHKCIEQIETLETEVPKELRQGVMSIGNNICKGSTIKGYLTTDKEYRNCTLTIIGPNRSGKSSLIANLSNDGVNNGECVIIFDYCGNCELSNEVSKSLKNKKILMIDCANDIQGLGYNEMKNDSLDTFKTYRNAKIQTSQLLTLVNSVNAENKELSAKMDRYLESAALIVFISGGTIKDVFATLQNHIIRKEFIDKIPESQICNLEEYVLSVKELDDTDKKGEVIGSRLSMMAGIIDRINRLKQNPYMELMLKKDCSMNIDLTKEIQKNQLICIKMPEIMFTTETEKDIYATYWMTKIWLALQIRKWEMPDRDKHTKVNLIIDELYQVPHCQDLLRSKLSQMPKFTCKPIISCHYLGQIPIIRDELKAANSSYMLICGTVKDNYKELKEELYPFTLDDLMSLKRYESLNCIKYENGYAQFITKLPKPI